MERLQVRFRRARDLLLIALGSSVLVLAAYLAPGVNLGDRLEYRTVDWRFRLRERLEPDPRILIVEVNDESLEQVGKWPWPRSRWAELTNLLSQAGAQAIVFDIFFPERSDPQEDAAFVEATRQAGKVYQPAFASTLGITADQASAQSPGEQLALQVEVVPGHGFDAGAHLAELPGLLNPYSELTQAAAGVGFADIADAGDGVFRYVFPLVQVGEAIHPSLALRVSLDLLAAQSEPLTVQLGEAVEAGGKLRIPLDRAGRMLINFVGPRGTYPRRSAGAVLAGEVDPEDLRDKVILVAATAPGLHDLRASPFGAAFEGVETQANLLDNLLTGRYLVEVEPEKTVVLAVLLSLLVAAAFMTGSTGGAVCISGALLVLYNYLCVWGFESRGIVAAILAPSVNLVLTLVALLVYCALAQERTTQRVYRTLSKYVSSDAIGQLGEKEEGALGVRRAVTVLFSDLRDFTPGSGRLQPEEVVNLLNRYFSLMYETLSEFGGTLDKYLGDGLMAYFLSLPDEDEHAVLAVHTAVEMQRRIQANQDEWSFYGMPGLRAGIGIATGEEVLGNVGSPDRMQYTVIGPAVNLAARLAELTKTEDADIIMDQRTYELAQDYIDARCLGPRALRGFEQAQVVYEALRE